VALKVTVALLASVVVSRSVETDEVEVEVELNEVNVEPGEDSAEELESG
jgi:hypothetical protein